MIKAVIFDFAGVIVPDAYWGWIKDTVEDFEKEKPFFEKISDQCDLGQITSKDFEAKIAERAGLDPAQVWPMFEKRFTLNTELVQYIRELKPRYKLGILSNFTYGWFDELFAKHGLEEVFDVTAISSRLGVMKPDPGIYEKALAMLKVNKDEAVFIDDRQYNVDGGNQFGIKSLLYIDLDQLKKDFKELGIR